MSRYPTNTVAVCKLFNGTKINLPCGMRDGIERKDNVRFDIHASNQNTAVSYFYKTRKRFHLTEST